MIEPAATWNDGPLDEAQLDATWAGMLTVLKSSKGIGRDSDGRIFYLSYEPNDANPGGLVCNRLYGNGAICRLPRGHVSEYHLPHMEFDPNLVVSSGVYVVQIAPIPESETTP